MPTSGLGAPSKFSVDRGFFDAPIDVTISTTTPQATIRYTIDGTAPTPTSGLLYTGPVHISSTTTLRAAAFRPGYRSTNVDTETYIFLDQVRADRRGLAGDLERISGGLCDGPHGR